MTADPQRYAQYPLSTKCYRQQEPPTYHMPSNNAVRPSTLLKLSEHIKSKRYSLNLLTRDNVKDNRTKRKMSPYTSAFRPTPSSSPRLDLSSSPRLDLSSPRLEPNQSHCKPSPTNYQIEHMEPQQKVYYVSGLQLLSWVSSQVERLDESKSVKAS